MITTDLNPVPSRKSPETFSDDMDTFLGKLPDWADEANELSTGCNTNALAAAGSASDAAEAAAEAAGSASDAADQVVLAANEVSMAADQVSIAYSVTNFKGVWDTLSGGLNMPASVFWSNRNWQLLENLADVTLHEPGLSDKWRVIKEPITRAEAFYLWSM